MKSWTYITLCLVLLLVTSYRPDNGLETFKLKTKKHKLFIDIPQAPYQTLKTTSNHGDFFEFIYPDSSLIYYSTDPYLASPNLNNLSASGWSARQNKTHDTILVGQTKDGRYWKEIRKNNTLLGYINVVPDKKALYELSLYSIRKRNNSQQ